jgi:AraC-like DNA-binding protein
MSATLMFALRNPFTLVTGAGDSLEARAALIAPGAFRESFRAVDSDIVILDVSVATPEYFTIAPLLHGEPLRELPIDTIMPLSHKLLEARRGELGAVDIRKLVHEIITLYACRPITSPELDPRIERILELIEEYPLDTASLSMLGKQVHLSASRLRHLFREQIGCDFTQYRRWTALWKAGLQYFSGGSFTQSGRSAGFHDSAHLNRSFQKTFGTNPSDALQLENVKLIPCNWN